MQILASDIRTNIKNMRGYLLTRKFGASFLLSRKVMGSPSFIVEVNMHFETQWVYCIKCGNTTEWGLKNKTWHCLNCEKKESRKAIMMNACRRRILQGAIR